MLLSEFKVCFRNLSDSFGQVSEGDKFNNRILRYYPHFENKNSTHVHTAFINAEKTEHKMPPLAVMLEYVRIETARNVNVLVEPTFCGTCNSTGTLIVRDKDKYRSVWRCPNCDNCLCDYPVWSSDKYSEGYFLEPEIVWNEFDDYQIKGLEVLSSSFIKKFIPEDILEKLKARSCQNKNQCGEKSI